MPEADPTRAAPRELLLRWLLAGATFALLLFFFSPGWAAFATWARVPEMGGMLEVRRGVSVLAQVEHPGAPVPDKLHAAIQWRLLFPLLGHLLHLPASVFFALAHVGAVLVLGFVITVLRRNGRSWPEAAAGAAVVGAAGWFFASTGWLGYFDAWVVLALLVVAFARTSWPVWLACLWAPWIDERFVLGAVLALACRYAAGTDWRVVRREATVAVALLGVFVLVRLGLLGSRSAAGATPGGYLAALDVDTAPWSRVLLGVWEGARAGWLFAIGGIVALARTRRVAAVVLALLVVALVIVGLRTAQDFGRAMMLIAPAIVLGLLHLRTSRVVLVSAAAASLLLPAHHVMSDRVNPIFYLYHELAAFDSPPPGAMPELYELKAIREMQENNFTQAEADLTLAIKLARNPAAPARQRGVLRASQGRWRDAAEDFALLARHDPRNPDAWFMCAQAELALGRAAAAREHFQRALSLAAADWPTRPDVARFRARLEQAK